ncbi:hypothetical protein K443DRAFT_681701, partial [Laccaria amethystina LaAM-08-1]
MNGVSPSLGRRRKEHRACVIRVPQTVVCTKRGGVKKLRRGVQVVSKRCELKYLEGCKMRKPANYSVARKREKRFPTCLWHGRRIWRAKHV